MADLLNEKDYKETIDSGVKTWQWLKRLFGGKEMSDDDFIEALVEEAQDKELEVDKEIDDLQKETLDNENKPNLENINENAKVAENINENKGESLENNDDFVDSFLSEASENAKLIKGASAKDIKHNKELSAESAESSQKNEKDGKENVKNLGAENEQESTLGYFTRKKEEIEVNKQMKTQPQSKESFKRELMEYSAKRMSADEMRVMIAVLHSKNNKITPEHKLLIKDCLDIARQNNPNFEFLSNGYKAIVKLGNNKTLGTQSIKEFINLANNPKDKLDSSIMKSCKEICAKQILDTSKNLPQETTFKLTKLINPALAKTMEIGASMGRAMGK